MLKALLSAALTPLLLSACTAMPANHSAPPSSASPAGSTVAAGKTFSLTPGQQVAVADAGTLRYVALTNDSRCPPGVQCVWAGDATLAFEWSAADGRRQSFALHTGLEPRSQSLGTGTLRLVSVERGLAPAATLEWSTP